MLVALYARRVSSIQAAKCYKLAPPRAVGILSHILYYASRRRVHTCPSPHKYLVAKHNHLLSRHLCLRYFAVYKCGFEILFTGLCFAASAWTSSKGPSPRHAAMYSAWNASSHHVKIVVRMQKWLLAQHVAKILVWVSIGRLICKVVLVT